MERRQKTQMAVALLAALAGGAFAKVHVGQRQPCFDGGAQVRGCGLISGCGKGIVEPRRFRPLGPAYGGGGFRPRFLPVFHIKQGHGV